MRETCHNHKDKQFLHPIIDWTDKEVWEYIRTYNVPYCELYDKGFTRIGCIMCPMNTKKKKEAELYPKYAENYRRACCRAFDNAIASGFERKTWKDGNDMYYWWLNEKNEKAEDDKLIPLFGLMGDESML